MDAKKLRNIVQEADLITKNSKTELKKPVIIHNKDFRFKFFKLYFALRDRGYSNNWRSDFARNLLLGASVVFFIFLLAADPDIAVVFYGRIILFSLTLILIILIFFKSLKHILSYFWYKDWQKRLTFKLSGWDEISSNDKLIQNANWYKECYITIHLNPGCTQLTTGFIHAACIVFCKYSNDVENQFESGINAWTFNNMQLKGSANCAVLGFIYRFISEDLNLINKMHGGISSVELSYSENTIEISMRPTESSGM